jgi:hypothetical protein
MSSKKVHINWTVLRRFLGKRLFIRVRAYLQRMWFICSYCGLFANNVVSFADNVVLRPLLFAVNVVSKSACLQFHVPMFAVRYKYSLHRIS